MNQEIVNWYRERVEAYLIDPQAAQAKYHLSLELLLEILKENLGLEKEAAPQTVLQEAQEILKRLASGEALAQNVPAPENLRWWQEELEKAEARKREIREKVIQEIRAKIQKRQAMWAKIRNALQETGDPALNEEPETTQALALEIEESLTEQILQEPQELSEEVYQNQIIASESAFDQKLRKKGIFLPPDTLQTLLSKIASETTEEAVSLARLEIPEEETLAGRVVPGKAPALVPLAGPSPKAAVIEPEKPLFTAAIQQKFADEEEGVAVAPLYTLLHPHAAISFLKKIALSPYVKSLQFLDLLAGEELKGEALKEWREKLHQGLSSQDLAESYRALLEAGVSPEQPQMKTLLQKETRMKHYEETHRATSAILKHYHEFTKITGRRQIFWEEIKSPLPRLSPPPSWFSKIGKASYSLRLKRTLDDLGSHFFYEKRLLPSGKTITYFSLPNKAIRLASLGKIQTYEAVGSWASRKILKPVLTNLGKTALGQGIKKGAAAILARLGLAAIPTGVTQVAVVVLLIPDALRLIKGLFRKFKENPALLIVGGIVALILPFITTILPLLVPIMIGLGVISIGAGLLLSAKAWAGNLLAGAGNFLGGLANGASGLLSSLSTISVPSVLPLVGVGGAGIGVTAMTTLVLFSTYGAFLKEPSKEVGVPVPYAACSLTPDTPGSKNLKELIINASQWAGIPPAVLAAIASIEGPHLFTYSDEQIQRYSTPGTKDPVNCQPNGCGARGPMQFLNNGVATNCGVYTGQTMPDVWAKYKDAVNLAIPAEKRTPEICNIKDSLYAAAWKIKTDSETLADQNCSWNEEIITRVASAYFGGDCTTKFQSLGEKTYCQYVWDYYRRRGLIQTPSPSGWFFWQGDPQWNPPVAIYDTRYGTIAISGCGPTSLAMSLVRFGIQTTPVLVWNETINRGFMTSKGISWDALVTIPKSYGLISENLGNNWQRVEQKLRDGYLVVASTTQFGGHILVIRGIEGNKIITNDPAYNNGDGMPHYRNEFSWINFWAIKR